MKESRDKCIGFVESAFHSSTFNSMEIEGRKGSISEVFPFAVRLEPSYREFSPVEIYKRGEQPRWVEPYDDENKEGAYTVYQIRLPLWEKVDFVRLDMFLSNIASIDGIMSFEIIGNRDGIRFLIGADSIARAKLAVNHLQSAIPEIVPVEAEDPLESIEGEVIFQDLYSPEPYYRKMGHYPQMNLVNFMVTASQAPSEALCFFQVLFTPCLNDWHKNIKAFVSGEDVLKARSPFGKTPSSMIKNPVKPLFAVRVRCGLIAQGQVNAMGLQAFAGSFLYAGRPLRYRTEADFLEVLKAEDLLPMLRRRTSHTSGMLLNSEEMSSCFVYFPDKTVKSLNLPLNFAKGFRVPERLKQEGRLLGFNTMTGKHERVYMPDLSNKCLYMIGISRKGKTTSMIHQAYQLAMSGTCGVGFLDPHRTGAKEFVSVLPESLKSRIKYFDFDDPHNVVNYNPFIEEREENFGRLSIDYVNTFKNLFDAKSFHRTNHLLGRGIYALFVLKKNLVTLPQLFSPGLDGEKLRREVIAKTKNSEVMRFWQHDFKSYPRDAFLPILNRLSDLFLDYQAFRIFSCEKNDINPEAFMNNGDIPIFALPASIDVSSTVGGFISSQFQKPALVRAAKGLKDFKPFFFFVDEFHRFISSAKILESIIDETVKGGLHICMAHQQTGQIPDDMLKAVLSMPNSMVFNVNLLDAKRLLPMFQGKVEVDDFLSLKVGEVIAKIDGEVVDFKCPPPLEKQPENVTQEIIEYSRKNYYSPSIAPKEKDGPKVREFDTF